MLHEERIRFVNHVILKQKKTWHVKYYCTLFYFILILVFVPFIYFNNVLLHYYHKLKQVVLCACFTKYVTCFCQTIQWQTYNEIITIILWAVENKLNFYGTPLEIGNRMSFLFVSVVVDYEGFFKWALIGGGILYDKSPVPPLTPLDPIVSQYRPWFWNGSHSSCSLVGNVVTKGDGGPVWSLVLCLA